MESNQKMEKKDCLSFINSKKIIKPQHALKVLNDKIKNKDFFITTEVGNIKCGLLSS